MMWLASGTKVFADQSVVVYSGLSHQMQAYNAASKAQAFATQGGPIRGWYVGSDQSIIFSYTPGQREEAMEMYRKWKVRLDASYYGSISSTFEAQQGESGVIVVLYHVNAKN